MNGPLSGSLGSPKSFANWVQFEMRIGVFTGPPGARPTNAAIDVLTPSIGLDVDGTASTYTPGVRYVGMSFLRSDYLHGAQFGQQVLGYAGEDPARSRGAGIHHLHDVLGARPQHDLRVRAGRADELAELLRVRLVEVEHDDVGLQPLDLGGDAGERQLVADDLDAVVAQQAPHPHLGH